MIPMVNYWVTSKVTRYALFIELIAQNRPHSIVDQDGTRLTYCPKRGSYREP